MKENEEKSACTYYEISPEVLYHMEDTIRNFKAGNVSQPVDLSDFDAVCEANVTATEDV